MSDVTIIIADFAKMAQTLTLGVKYISSQTVRYNMNYDIYWADDFLYIQKISIAYMKYFCTYDTPK